jgi:excisionase family DNA binding protein
VLHRQEVHAIMREPPISPVRPKPRRDSRAARARADAVSSGQAARFCYVTSDTIVNWIRADRLPAQRTAGGQYRIRVGDLLAFMRENGMSTALLEAERDVRPYCWEFHCEVGSPPASSRPSCEGCLARRAGTLNCWEIHGLLPLTARRVERCDRCDYYLRYGAGHEP